MGTLNTVTKIQSLEVEDQELEIEIKALVIKLKEIENKLVLKTKRRGDIKSFIIELSK
jgi:hypothetical protein